MELARPASRPRQRSRSSHSDIDGTDIDHVAMENLNIESPSAGETRYEPWSQIPEMKTKLFDQEGIFLGEQEKMKQKKEGHKQKVKCLFDKLRDILTEKEKKINDKIDFEFNGTEQYVSTHIAAIIEDKLQLNVLGEHEDNCAILESKIARRDEIIASIKMPELSLNDNAVQVLSNLKFGGLADVASDVDSSGEEKDDQEVDAACTNVAQTRSNRNSSSDMRIRTNVGREALTDVDCDTPTPTNDPAGWITRGNHHRLEENRAVEDQGQIAEPGVGLSVLPQDETIRVGPSSELASDESVQSGQQSGEATRSDGYEILRTPSGQSVDSLSQVSSVSRLVEGAIGGVTSHTVMPSAPVIEDIEGEPPSYWQAVGLDGPEGKRESQIPGYYDIEHEQTALPSNKLEPWHSFPIQRQYDKRTPLPCALVWHKDLIVVGDRANRKVKVYNPSGLLKGEWLCPNEEIHDVAFLEEANGESRFLVTCPRSGALHLLSVNAHSEIKVVHSWNSQYGYNTVCRGPVSKTLVGGHNDRFTNSGKVHIFDFRGRVLTQFLHTPKNVYLKYPRKVLVHGHNVIACDWKLTTVCVYLDNGQSIAEYRGTPQNPLCNPIDMTLDHCGNIMIMDGEMCHIHVIDLDCNPLEIIHIPKNFAGHKSAKYLAFDTASRRLAITRSNGDIAIFTFRDGYDGLPQRRWGPQNMFGESPSTQPQQPVNTLPLVEGMLPSTIEQFVTRGSRNKTRPYNL